MAAASGSNAISDAWAIVARRPDLQAVLARNDDAVMASYELAALSPGDFKLRNALNGGRIVLDVGMVQALQGLLRADRVAPPTGAFSSTTAVTPSSVWILGGLVAVGLLLLARRRA